MATRDRRERSRSSRALGKVEVVAAVADLRRQPPGCRWRADRSPREFRGGALEHRRRRNKWDVLRFHESALSALLAGALLLIPGNGKTGSALAATTEEAPPVSRDDAPPASQEVRLPLNLERRVGDLGEMVRRRAIRALVVIDPISFFY